MSDEPPIWISPITFYAFVVGVLTLIGKYILDPLADWLDKRAIFNYRPRFGLKRDRKRQAKCLLEQGLALLRKGSIDEADVRLGAALKVNPHLVESLSRKQQQSLILELERYRNGGLNAANLLLQLWAAQEESRARKQ
jgi:hypothetical protein